MFQIISKNLQKKVKFPPECVEENMSGHRRGQREGVSLSLCSYSSLGNEGQARFEGGTIKMGLKIAGKYFRGGTKPETQEIAKILRNRGRGGPLFRVGPNQFAVMRIADERLSDAKRTCVLSKSSFRDSRIVEMPKVQTLLTEIKQLSDLGEVGEIEIDGQTYELVLGLRATPEVISILNKSVGEDHYAFGGGEGEDIVEVLTAGAIARMIADTINAETGFELSLLDRKTSKGVIRKFGEKLRVKGVHSFWIEEFHGGNVDRNRVTLQPGLTTGLVFARPKVIH